MASNSGIDKCSFSIQTDYNRNWQMFINYVSMALIIYEIQHEVWHKRLKFLVSDDILTIINIIH